MKWILSKAYCPFRILSMKSFIKNSRGHVIVEYILLLVISVGLASLIVKQLVNRDDQNPGVLTSKWLDIVRVIGSDQP